MMICMGSMAPCCGGVENLEVEKFRLFECIRFMGTHKSDQIFAINTKNFPK